MLTHRIQILRINVVYFACCVAICSNIAWTYRPDDYAVDGLNSLRYKLLANESRPLYTWLQVQLPPQPS